jgi:hypothetical protein
VSPFKVVALGGVAILAFAIGTRGWQQSRVDHDLEQHCAVDGGATIYERVTLPASRFSSSAGRSKLLLGPEFREESRTEHFIRGESEKGNLSSTSELNLSSELLTKSSLPQASLIFVEVVMGYGFSVDILAASTVQFHQKSS